LREAGFRHKVRTRILSNGPNTEDKQSLLEWHATLERAKKNDINQAVSELKIDPASQEKGAKLFKSNKIISRINKISS
jgi:hypothetical protein